MLMTAETLKPVERAIVEALETSGEWITRTQLARAIGRPTTLQPADYAALERLVNMELIEVRTVPRGIAGTKYEYRVKQ